MPCNEAIEKQLQFNAKKYDVLGSLFYILLNGWYLGNWGDYGSCLVDATEGQYIMATVSGDYD